MMRGFVGRTDVIESVLGHLRDPNDRAYVHVVYGIHGIGKSQLLERLEGDAESVGALPLRLNADRFVEETIGGDDPANERVRSQFLTYKRLLQHIVDEATRKAQTRLVEFRTRAEAQQDALEQLDQELREQFRIGALTPLRDAATRNRDFARELSEARASQIEAMVDELHEELAEATLELFSRRQPLLVLVDDFVRVRDSPIARWFMSGIQAQRNAVAVLAAVDGSAGADDETTVHRLRNFTREEIEESLRMDLEVGEDGLPDGLVEAVQRFSGGHPGAVGIAADWVLAYGMDRLDTPAQVWGLFRHLPSKTLEGQMADLVDRITAQVTDPDLNRVMKEAWVFRRFDADALCHMLDGEHSDSDRDCGDLIKSLKKYSFFEAVPEGPDGWQGFRFHEYLRVQRDDPSTASRKKYQSLHERAASYYYAQLNEQEEELGAPGSYEGWYRYEKPRWQQLKSEWLYHVSRLTDRTKARRGYLRLFLDAFWWWGCYQHFEFCDTVLSEWAQYPMDRAWWSALRMFHDSYPTRWEWEEKRNRRDWSAVRDAMLAIRRIAELAKRPTATMKDEELRHLRALTAVFLAHAIRHLRPGDFMAHSLYLEARRLFEANDDVWNVAWMRYEHGDLHAATAAVLAARGRRHAARRQLLLAQASCERALHGARSHEVDDDELAANTCRCLAEVRLAQGDHARCFSHCAEALYHALQFDSDTEHLDAYTRNFHADILEQVAAIALRVWTGGHHEEAVAGCRHVRAFFAAYFEQVDGGASVPDFAALLGAGDRAAIALELAQPPPDSGAAEVHMLRALQTLEAIRYRHRALRPT
jgi:hypothetical protein